jgi:hypothetical protein
VDHREFTRRYLAFMETWMKVSCLGMIVVLLIIIAANLIW